MAFNVWCLEAFCRSATAVNNNSRVRIADAILSAGIKTCTGVSWCEALNLAV